MSHKWDAKVDRTVAHVVNCEKCGVQVERVEVDGKLKNFHTPLGGERTKGLAPKCAPAGEQTEQTEETSEVTESATEVPAVPTVPVIPFQSASPEGTTNEVGYGAPCKDCRDVLTEENCTVDDSDQCDACDQKETAAQLA